MIEANEQETQYVAVVRPEPQTDGSYTWLAYHPDIPACMAHGASAQEALANLAEARAMVLRHLRAHSRPAPQPGSSKLAQEILAGGEW